MKLIDLNRDNTVYDYAHHTERTYTKNNSFRILCRALSCRHLTLYI